MRGAAAATRAAELVSAIGWIVAFIVLTALLLVWVAVVSPFEWFARIGRAAPYRRPFGSSKTLSALPRRDGRWRSTPKGK